MSADATLVPARRRPRSLRGLAVSVCLHLVLVVAACWIVFRTTTPARTRAAAEVFAVPGGGAPAAAPSSAPHPSRTIPVKVRQLPQRIAVKSKVGAIRLPEPKMPDLSGPPGKLLGAGRSTGGAGKGFGGGVGRGVGPGLATAYVGRPVMGAMIRAQRVAVYLDCSGSMRSYLPRVEAEIRRQFPDADVFRFDGARIVGLGDNIVHGRHFHGPAPALREGPSQTVVESLTAQGRQLHAQLRTACEKGSLGAWLDRLQSEPYDALVVFSDFQDGVRIYHDIPKKGPRLVYSDSSYHPVSGPRRPVYRWESAWLERFARAGSGGAPRLYLFSVQREPQAFLQRCVAASGGASVSVAWLRPGSARR